MGGILVLVAPGLDAPQPADVASTAAADKAIAQR
jgi:hypothetical protein